MQKQIYLKETRRNTNEPYFLCSTKRRIRKRMLNKYGLRLSLKPKILEMIKEQPVSQIEMHISNNQARKAH